MRQLEVFEAIARLKSFTRAAEELFLTQPTVSMQIKKLTDQVGLPLFEQIGKKIYLTDAGKELYKTCLGIFDHFSRFEMIASDMKGMKSGKLRISVVTTAKYFTPRLLGMFCKKFPSIDVALKVTNREHILERLVNNQDDLYVMGQVPNNIDAIAEVFLDNPMIVLAAIDHPLANSEKISINRISEEFFIMREPGSGTRLTTEQFFQKHNKKIKIRMELGSNEAIKQAVIGGLGIAILSRHTLSLDAPLGKLTILDVQDFPINRHWYLAYPCGKQLSIVAQAFLEYLKQAPDILSDFTYTHTSALTPP
ncbi:LysR family transcriptional regulator [Nitrosomonas sp. JL21]|uniref:LysR family transcriptional regulator n=1 Tax=Nitrosomonas sp. JL21 TaxID=153949 RepID=UPI0013DDE21C|nr:LysR family transcriptional regulator [Nitrosomonas sp. JL21]